MCMHAFLAQIDILNAIRWIDMPRGQRDVFEAGVQQFIIRIIGRRDHGILCRQKSRQGWWRWLLRRATGDTVFDTPVWIGVTTKSPFRTAWII